MKDTIEMGCDQACANRRPAHIKLPLLQQRGSIRAHNADRIAMLLASDAINKYLPLQVDFARKIDRSVNPTMRD